MTWAKYSTEFGDELAHAGLSDSAYRTHSEAIAYLYRLEDTKLRIPKAVVRRFAGSPDYELAIKELLAAGFWRDRGDAWEVVHHGDVIRQGIAAQRQKRERDKRAQREHRKRNTPPGTAPDVSADISDDVSAAVSGDTINQTTCFPPGTTNGVKRADPAVAK